MNKYRLKIQKNIYNWIINHPGYLKSSVIKILERIPLSVGANYDDCEIALKQARIDSKTSKPITHTIIKQAMEAVSKDVRSPKVVRDGLVFPENNFKNTPWAKKLKEFEGKIEISKYNPDNVLFIADLHAPWILNGYLEFCKEQQEKYDCGTIIFSGDIIDSGAWSYHEHDPDGYSVKDELYAAKKQLQKVYSMFPQAISLLGNHDLLISRKAKTAGLSQEFIKGLAEVLEAPKGWKFVHEFTKDNVRYIHGSTGNAFKRAVDSRISTCQGHLHSQTFVQWSVSEKDAIFGLQVGAGFDRDKYAFDYAKPFPKKPIIGCGIILDQGTTPFVKLMPL
jgi:calcineurin-like phosphoesterase family protein